MGEGRESRESESRLDGSREFGGVRVAPLAQGIALYSPPLRAAAPALMLALCGIALSLIALASVAGLVRSGETAAASMLALAFAGVFALPLFALGQFFIATALWTAGNSLVVEVTAHGIRTERRWLGYSIAQRMIASADIAAIDSRFAAKYLSIFSRTRCFRLFAAARRPGKPLLIADSLHGPAITEEVRRLVIEHLQLPALEQSGLQAHKATEEST